MRIALVGKMRSGKDSVASLLMPHGFTRVAFGDGIKEVIVQYFPEAFEKGKPREHYQKIGQCFRELNPEIWINYVDRTARDLEHVIVTDTRQKNEVAYLRKNGYMIIKVQASALLRMKRIQEAGDVFDPNQFYHETEKQVDLAEYDYLIENNGTIEELERQVRQAFEYYLNYFEPDKHYRELLEGHSYEQQR